jgi:hypothetical protein
MQVDKDSKHSKRKKNEDDESHHRKHKHRKKEKRRDRSGERKLELVDDDPPDDVWKEKDLTEDGERVRSYTSIAFTMYSCSASSRFLQQTSQQQRVSKLHHKLTIMHLLSNPFLQRVKQH